MCREFSDGGSAQTAGDLLKIKSVLSRKRAHWEELMNRRTTASMLAGVLIAASPALAADVTPERLVNADGEPQNWLMNHRTYDAQRYSPLDKINKGNVKDLKLAYAVAIGGTSANDNLEATPLARGRIPLRRRSVGRALQDRCAFRQGGPDRVAHGPGTGEGAAREPRSGALGQPRHHGCELSAAHARNRQGHRQSGVGNQSRRRPNGFAAHGGATRGQGQDHPGSRRRRSRG